MAKELVLIILELLYNGKLVRLKVGDISSFGRSAQGVRLIRLNEGELLAEVAKVEDKEQEEQEGQEVNE